MMRVKRYQASTLEEALHLVRAELGRDAIILETHRTRLPGLRGLLAPQFVEVSAVGDNADVHVAWDGLTRLRESEPSVSGMRGVEETPLPEPAPEAPPLVRPFTPRKLVPDAPEGVVADLTPAARSYVPQQFERTATVERAPEPVAAMSLGGFAAGGFTASPGMRAATTEVPVVKQAPPAAMPVMIDDTALAMAAEMSQLQASLSQVHAALRDLTEAQSQIIRQSTNLPAACPAFELHHPATAGDGVTVPAAPSQESAPLGDALLLYAEALGLSPSLIRTWMAAPPAGLPSYTNEMDPEAWLQRALETELAVTGALEPSGESPIVLLLVGGTGVGKTTAAARLAALLAGEGPVALTTLGNSGFTSTSQVLTHCVRQGVTFRACGGTAGLQAFLSEEGDRFKYVVADSPGGNLAEPEAAGLIAEARRMGADLRVLLVASASTQPAVIRNATAALGPGIIDGLVVSKLDEAGSAATIISGAVELGLPLAYLSTGQSLDAGLQLANVAEVTAMLLGGPAPESVPAGFEAAPVKTRARRRK